MKTIKEFNMSLQNKESVLFTNGLLWYTFSKIGDEIKLHSYLDEMLDKPLDNLTWDYNFINVGLCYDAYIELVNGYNSSKESRAYQTYKNELELNVVEISA